MLAQYRKPPITEAAIEFRFTKNVDREMIEKAQRRFSKDYSVAKEVKEFQVAVQFATSSSNVQASYGGMQLWSAEGADLVWLRPSGLVVSRLSPYVGWETFRSKAFDAWAKWRKATGKSRLISRLGLRYINRIDIPVNESERIRLEDYLGIGPLFPDPDQEFISYTLQTQLPLGEGYVATINTGSAPPALINHLSFLLDIDVGREDVPQSDEEVWSMIELMRQKKNSVFEGFLTAKTRELFSG